MLNPFVDTDTLLAAIAAPPVPNRDETAHRIANDGLVQKVALELAVQSFVLDAVKEICKSNHARETLLKRVGAVGITKPVFHAASWTVGRGTVSGRPRIDGICDHCKQSITLIAPETGDGGTGKMGRVTLPDIERVLAMKFSHCGQAEAIPEEIRTGIFQTWRAWGQVE